MVSQAGSHVNGGTPAGDDAPGRPVRKGPHLLPVPDVSPNIGLNNSVVCSGTPKGYRLIHPLHLHKDVTLSCESKLAAVITVHSIP